MTKYHRNHVGSLVLDRTGGGNFRRWPAFSGSAFRRKIIDTMRCGVSRYRREEESGLRSREEKLQVPDLKRNGRSERLSDLLNLTGSESGSDDVEAETRRKVEVFEELRGVVKRLQFEDGAQRDAAMEVRRLAKDDSDSRVTLAMLGAIPPLVGMIDSDEVDFQISSLYALLNLSIGNEMNKKAIVEAGAIHKMLKLIESKTIPPPVSEAIVANFLGLSALDSNKLIIGSSGAIPFLTNIFQNLEKNISSQAKQDSLKALFNLSISPSNIPHIIESGLVPFLISTLGDMQVSERVLSILSNVVSTSGGRKALGNSGDAFPILVDVLNWTDSPGCQEKSSYILMVMAHKAYGDRTAMIEAGIVSALLELTLLGSTLAQKRASRILECLRVDKGKQVSEGYSGVSAPLCGSSSSCNEVARRGLKEGVEEVEDEDMMSTERRAVKQLVQQSLQDNMNRIVKRANLPQDFAPSDHFKSLTATSTSKSLPL
ncbi:U-box domain-containing protein 45-like [Tasmannia lanceolata]|uniref:U-box domain-containing protein 45-like n=1 Tax=Tasmannia lanceolata TaxID=3420 RepID=UPI0040638074